jgi:DNA mismatch endonuclease (patch repair protein)
MGVDVAVARPEKRGVSAEAHLEDGPGPDAGRCDSVRGSRVFGHWSLGTRVPRFDYDAPTVALRMSHARFSQTPDATRRRMKRVRRRDTPGEVAIRKRLWASGLRYRVDVEPVPGMGRRADIVFRRARLAVFVDGCFWHGCPDHGSIPSTNGAWWRMKIQANALRDADTSRRLSSGGWRVIRIWEHEDPVDAANAVFSALGWRVRDQAAQQ